MEKLEASKRTAQRLKEHSESAARSAYERALEAQKLEEARAMRIREIQLMEAQRTYELQKEKARKPKIPTAPSDEQLDYLRLVPDHQPAVPLTPTPLERPREPSVAPISPGPKFYSEGGALLRALMIPSSVVATFLEIASANTRRNIETCGVLAGKLSQNRFTVTHLIVPRQEGTSDTCSMVGEEDVLHVQDRLDLLTLGWIHTHPTQQCFLSSVDLHTHFPYQLMMAEAIAIVVAPTQTPNYGVFRLTDPPGLGVIADCPARGFHPHHCDQPIYTSLGGPSSHAQLDSSLNLEVIDLR
jgi:STAM-binding protein